MKILITGHNGFIGKNAKHQLRDRYGHEIITFGSEDKLDILKNIINEIDVILHFAGLNKSENENDFYKVNENFTKKICQICVDAGKKIPIIFTSSIHVSNSNSYGLSKLAAEKVLIEHSNKNNSKIYIFRLPHVIGKWSKPNYNSVVSTFCYNIARNIPINIFDEENEIEIVYIDDLIEKIDQIISNKGDEVFCTVEKSFKVKIKQLAKIIKSFNERGSSKNKENLGSGLFKILYSTYLSYLPTNKFAYSIEAKSDKRGKFVEFLKSNSFGQISFLTINPGMIRGGHYHHTKIEKFLLVKGQVLFRFKNIESNEFYEILVTDSDTMIVESIPGWSHDIVNNNEEDAIIIIWANEIYDPLKPDTILKPLD